MSLGSNLEQTSIEPGIGQHTVGISDREIETFSIAKAVGAMRKLFQFNAIYCHGDPVLIGHLANHVIAIPRHITLSRKDSSDVVRCLDGYLTRGIHRKTCARLETKSRGVAVIVVVSAVIGASLCFIICEFYFA